MKSVHKIAELCSYFSRDETRMEFRAFRLDGEYCNEYTSMHEKKIITPELTLVGSYNLTYQARVYNSESSYCIATIDQDTSRFDAEWASLSDRVIDIFNPDKKLFTKAPSIKRKASDDGK